MLEDEKQPFFSHLTELRKRLIVSFIAVGIGFVISYFFKEYLFKILTIPLIKVMKTDGQLIFTGLPEAFFTYIKVAFLSGVMLASPVILYQFWKFVAPGLYKKEKTILMPTVIISSFFFIAGALFGYFVVFPWGFEFFLSFATETIKPLPSMREYLSFASKVLIAFGISFEMPIVITFLAKLGIVTPEFLRKKRKYALILFFIAAAILTPPDVVTQTMMALPLIFLYEMSIIGAKVFGKKKQEDKEEAEAAAEEETETKDEKDKNKES